MDISHQKFTNSSSTWQPYNNMSAASVEENLFHDQTQTPFEGHHTQWPNYYPSPIIQNHNEPSNIASPGTFPSMDHDHQHQTANFKVGEFAGDHNQDEDEQEEELGAVKEMMFKIAAMQPVDIDPATICKPRRRNVRISDDPQSVAARHRRERISEKIRIMQRLVPGGTKMDTASMLDEAIRYVKFLKRQIRILQGHHHQLPPLQPSATSTIPGIPYLFGGNTNGDVAGDDHQGMCFNHKFINGDH